MKTTRTKKELILLAGLWLLNTTPGWAAIAGREDNSDFFVWIFLAFCALIIVAQLAPALLVIFGFARGVKKQTVEPAAETVDT